LPVDNVFVTLLLDDECVFLGYSAEYKGYRCWNPVGRKMRTTQDVAFDEPRPFYLHPSSDASSTSLVEPLSCFSLMLIPLPCLPLLRLYLLLWYLLLCLLLSLPLWL
jgi:hypothetical protein